MQMDEYMYGDIAPICTPIIAPDKTRQRRWQSRRLWTAEWLSSLEHSMIANTRTHMQLHMTTHAAAHDSNNKQHQNGKFHWMWRHEI